MDPRALALVGAGYLAGAVPFGFIIARLFYKTDIRTVGSKNPGATNVWRTFGRTPGMFTLALDIIKGVAPVLAARHFTSGEVIPLLTGMAAIAGHNWSIFLMGKGGKGVATSAGVFLALLPKAMTVALASFVVIFMASKTVSIGSMGAAGALVIAVFFFPTSVMMKVFVGIAAILIVIKHIPNIKRLLAGTEPKVNFK